MRKPSILLLFVLLTACSTFDTSSDEANLELSKVTSVLTLPVKEQRLAFDLLSRHERTSLWETSLDNKVKSHPYNNAQLQVVEELRSALRNGLLGNPSRFDTFQNTWLNKAVKVFTEQEVFDITFKIDNYGSVAPNRVPDDGGGDDGPVGPNCHCNYDAVFTCGSGTNPNKYCQQKTCANKTLTGCGFLWQFPCNGICGYAY